MDALRGLTRPVRLIAAGGTIAMRGERAVPVLDAAGLIEELPQLAAGQTLQAEAGATVPGPQLRLREALKIAQRVVESANSGEGVVITTGTDTMEELAALCA